MSAHLLTSLEPQRVFDYFYRITQIPRPSKKEEKIRVYILETAKKLNREALEDSAGNIVVRKPATAGYETAPIMILQGHLDMVCEKVNGHTIDFDNDPLEIRIENDWISATQTTLGADNGIAVAAMLAILEDDRLRHGPLELLFTIDEETGLTGATKLDPKMIRGNCLLNLDSEEQGQLFVGCAGGKDCLITVPVKWKSADKGMVPMEIKVEGGAGGHSGLDIHSGRANAIKILTRVLWNLLSEFPIRLSDIHGGSKRNAIPRDAAATIMVPEGQVSGVKKRTQAIQKTVKSEFRFTDPNLKIGAKDHSDDKAQVMKKSHSEKILDLLYALPNGVMAMSHDIPGLVETSVNLATIETNRTSVVIGSSHRSSVESEKRDLVDRVMAVTRLADAKARETDGYPGWKPNMQSKILAMTKEVFSEMYGKEPLVTAIHAGLECGIIGEKFPEMDMISFGPTIRNAHSPDERLYIPSVKPFYDCVVRILEKAAGI